MPRSPEVAVGPPVGELGDAAERDMDENMELELERRGCFFLQLKMLDDVDVEEEDDPALPGVEHSTVACSKDELIGCLLQLSNRSSSASLASLDDRRPLSLLLKRNGDKLAGRLRPAFFVSGTESW